MSDRLFLNWIDMTCDDFAVDEELEFADCVLAYSAEAYLSVWYVAVSGAGSASNP